MENINIPEQVSDDEMRELIKQGREHLKWLKELNAQLDQQIAESKDNENKRPD